MGSPAWRSTTGATIPKRFTCSGTGVSAPLTFFDPPAATRQLALVVEDPDTDRFPHWTVLRIPPDTPGFDAGKAPHGTVQTTNGLGEDALADEVRNAIAAHAIARGDWVGRFGR